MASFRIRDLIEESIKVGNRVTQTDLAKDAGVAIATITRIANNQRKGPDPETLQSIADTFTKALGRKITLDDLIERNGDKESSYTSGVGISENLHVTDAPTKYDSLAEDETMKLEDVIPVEPEDFVALPILGDIPCGNLDLVEEENIIGHQWMHKDMIGKGKFFVRAKGTSMSPRIENEDLLLIEPGNHWDNGTTIVAYINGEMTCKKVVLSDTQAVLVPENHQYPPIVVREEMHIIGRVTKVVKNFVEDWRP